MWDGEKIIFAFGPSTTGAGADVSEVENKEFEIYISGSGTPNMPNEACIDIATQDWNSIASGIIGIEVNRSTLEDNTGCIEYEDDDEITACAGGANVPLPITVEQAVNVCKNNNSTVLFKFK